MLKRIKAAKVRTVGGRFAIVASEYNPRYVEAMVRAAKAELQQAGAAEIQVVRVPGAFEIPVAAARLARKDTSPFDAVICLGVILRGATTHAQHIGEVVTQQLAAIAVECEVPMIHEVLLLENEEQARERCLDAEHNRGREAAQTALKMTRVMGRLAQPF